MQNYDRKTRPNFFVPCAHKNEASVANKNVDGMSLLGILNISESAKCWQPVNRTVWSCPDFQKFSSVRWEKIQWLISQFITQVGLNREYHLYQWYQWYHKNLVGRHQFNPDLLKEQDLKWNEDESGEKMNKVISELSGGKMNKVISEPTGKKTDAGGQQEQQFEIEEKKRLEEEERIRLANQAEEQKKKDEKEAEAAIRQIETDTPIQVKIKSYASQKNIKIILV